MTTSHEQIAPRGREIVAVLASSMTRSEYFAALSIVGIANGLGSRMIESVAEHGLVEAIFYSFDISVIVWVAAIVGIRLVLEDGGDRIAAADLAVGAVFLFLTVIPIGGASWLAVTAMSLYLLANSTTPSSRRRAAIVLLALTIPMLWSRLLFRLFSEFILGMDAFLVGWILGADRAGNVVRFVDGSGDLVILPACSSLANLSLVFLCWIAMSQMVEHRWRSRDMIWCVLAGASVVGTNVARMSLMAVSESSYNALHEALGSFTTNLVALFLMVGFCALGLRRELFARV